MAGLVMLLACGSALAQTVNNLNVTGLANGDLIGDVKTVTVTFNMSGTAAANESIDLSVSLGAGLAFGGSASVSPSGAGGTVGGNTSGSSTITWTGIDLDAGGNGTYTLTIPNVTVNGGGSTTATATLSNAANVAVSGGSSDSDSVNTADLRLTLTAPSSITVGSAETFTVNIINDSGSRSAAGVEVTVNLPSGYAFQAGGNYGDCSLTSSNASTIVLSANTVGTNSTDNCDFSLLASQVTPDDYTIVGHISASTVPDSDSIPGNGSGNGEDDEFSQTVTPTRADLNLSMSVSPAGPNVGDCVTFTTTVTNNGPSNADNVDVDVTLPSGYTANNCAGPGDATVDFNGQNINNGSSIDLLTQALLTAGNGGSDTSEFTASAAITGSDTGLINTSDDSDTAAITQFVDISLDLVPGTVGLNPQVGGNETITVNVANGGNRSAPEVATCIQIPNGLTYVSDDGGADTTRNSQGCGLIWNAGTIAAAGSDSLSLVVSIDPSGSYVLSGEIVDFNPTGGIGPDSDSVAENGSTDEDDDDSITYNPVEVADLSLSLSVSDPTPDVGESPTFTLTLTNNGPSDHDGNIGVTYSVPSGYSFTSATPQAGDSVNTSGDPSIVWTVTGLDSGLSATLTLVAEVLVGSDYRHTAEVTSAVEVDNNSTPNNGVETENDFAALTAAPTSIALVVTADTTPMGSVAGAGFSYSFKIENTSTVNASAVQVSDIFPTFTTAPSAGFDGGDVTWQCEAFDGACCNSNSANCGATPNPTSPLTTALTSVPMDLAPLSSVIITVSGNLDSRSTGTLDNSVTATVASGSFEADTSDNTSINTLSGVPVSIQADLSVTKVNTDLTGTGPFTVDYDITVTNNGPSFVSGAQLTDLFEQSDPVDGDFFDPATAAWSCTLQGAGADSSCPSPASGSGAISAELVSLEPGASAVFDVSVDTVVTSGAVTNTASVAAPAGVSDVIGSNNSDTERVVLSGSSDLELTVQGPASAVTAGTDLTYTVQIFNNGPDFAPAATVTDVLPSAITNVSWQCSSVTPVPGDLALVDTVTNGQLDDARGFVFSPDGQHVYVASRSTDSLLAFRRETIPSSDFGEFSVLEIETNGVDDTGDFGLPVADMVNPVSVAISPDGRFVYVAAFNGSAVVWFQRDTTPASQGFGTLTFSGSLMASELGGVVDVVVSGDGQHLYAAVAGVSNVVWLNRDTGTGALSFETPADMTYPFDAQPMGPPSAPTSLRLTSDGQFLVVGAANTTGMETLRVLQRETDSAAGDFGALTILADYAGSSAGQVRITPDDQFVFVARPLTDVITRYALDAAGALSNPTDLTEMSMGLPAGALDGVGALAITADGEHMAAGASGASPNRVNYLRVNAVTGALSQQDGSQLVDGSNGIDLIAGPGFLGFSPDSRHLVVSSQIDDALTILDRRAPDPVLTFIEFEQDGLAGEPATPVVDNLIGPTSVVVSPDGNHVYVASVDGAGAIAAFVRNAAAGITVDTRGQNLRFIDSWVGGVSGVQGLTGVADLAFDPTGTRLYAASEGDNAIALFTRNPADGTLTFVEAIFDNSGGNDGLSGASGIAVDPDGNYLYVAARFEAAVGVYAIAADGTLSFVEKVTNADAGVAGLEGASDVVVAPDSGPAPGHVMVTSAVDNALVVFARDRATGMLTFDAAYAAGVGQRPLDLEVSPGGQHVYVAASNTSSVSVFARNNDEMDADFGVLALRAIYADGVDDITTLGGARDIVISPDGQRAYVVAENDHALNVFSVNTEATSNNFGELTFVESRIDGQEGVEGLDQTYSVTVSNDSTNVYAVGLDDNAVAAFRLGEGSRCPAGGSGNLSAVSVDVAPAGVLTFFISGTVKSSATTGSLTNTARVDVPPGFSDPVDSSSDGANFETDSVTTALAAEADLFIEKTDNRISSIAGDPTSYTITIGNLGPSDAIHNAPTSVLVNDILDGSDTADTADDDRFVLAETTWACTAIGSGSLSVTDVEDDAAGLTGVVSVAAAAAVGTLRPHLYAVSVLDDSLLVFEINPDNGTLAFVQRVTNGDAVGGMTATGLAGARDVTVSADGRFIYVVSQLGDAVSVFEASDAAGVLNLALIQQLDGATIPALDQLVSAQLNDGDNHLYVAAAKSNAVVLFSRSATTGMLTLQGSYLNGAGGISGMNGPSDLAVADEHVYVTATNSNAIVIFDRAAGGDLTYNATVTDDASLLLSSPSALALSPDADLLFVASTGDNAVSSFSRDTASGALTLVDSLQQNVADVTSLAAPRDLVVSADEFHLYVAAGESDAINIVSLGEDGTLVLSGSVSDIDDSGGLNGVAGLALNADASLLFSASELGNAVAAYQRIADSSCPVSGSGNMANVAVNIAAGGQIVFTLDTRIAADVDGSIRNTATIAAAVDADGVDCGDLEVVSDDNNNCATDINDLNPEADLAITKVDQYIEFDGLGGADALAVTPDGNFIYVAGRTEQAIALFRRNQTPPMAPGDPLLGEPVFVSFVRNGSNGVSGLNGVSDLVVSEDGQYLYAAATLDSALTVFAIDAATGALSILQDLRNDGSISGLSGARAVLLSADGQHVYAAGTNQGTIAQFDRDPASGLLSFLASIQNGLDGVASMTQPVDLAIAPDDSALYVVSAQDDSLLVFDRDADDQSANFGLLTQSQVLTTGIGGVASMLSPQAIAAEPGNRHVYVAAAGSGAVVTFERDAGTGSLAFVEALTGTQSTLIDLVGVASLQFSTGAAPAQLYAGAPDANGVAILGRDDTSGVLTPLGQIRQDDATAIPTLTVDGLSQVSDLLIVPGSSDFYAASPAGGALSLFERSPVDGSLSYLLTREDGGGGAPPGSVVTYVIEVVNNGPSDVTQARVTDQFPDQYSDISWTCEPLSRSGPATASCQASDDGSLNNEAVVLPNGTGVRFIASATLRPDAQGRVINTATVTAITALDPNPANNTAVDNDTVLAPAVDLITTNSNGLSTLNPGQNVNYTFTVSNAGPSSTDAVAVSHVLPEMLAFSSWSCDATPIPGRLTALADPAPLGQNQVMDIVFNADGSHAYAVGRDGGAGSIAFYRRDNRDGSMEPGGPPIRNGSVLDGDVVSGLGGAARLALSGDGLHLYVASSGDDAVAIFERDSVSGELGFVGRVLDGVAGVNGLSGASDVLVSADGSDVYVAGSADNAVARFSRNPATGALTFVSVLSSVQESGLDAPTQLVPGPGDDFVYVLSRSNDRITRLVRAPNGALSSGVVLQNDQLPEAALLAPSDMIFTGDGLWAWVSSAGSNALARFAVDEVSGILSFDQALFDGDPGVTALAGPEGLALANGDLELYVAGSAGLSLFSLVDGTLEQRQTITTGLPASLAGLALAPGERQLYLAADSIDGFDVNAGSRCASGGNGNINDLASLSAGGQITYSLTAQVSSAATGTIDSLIQAVAQGDVIELDPETNAATDSDPVSPQTSGVDVTLSRANVGHAGTTPVAGVPVQYDVMLINTSSSHALQATLDLSLAQFPALPAGVDPASISLTECTAGAPFGFDELITASELAGVADVAVSEDGNFLYALASDGRLSVYRLAGGTAVVEAVIADDDASGSLTVTGLAGAQRVVLGPLGQRLYVAATSSSQLLVFDRDVTSGSLELIQVVSNGQDNVVSMASPVDLVVAPDGQRLYVAASGSDSIVQLNAVSGTLVFEERVRDGFGTISPDSNVIRGVSDLTLSGDGSQLLAAGTGSDAVASFSVAASDGHLQYLGINDRAVTSSLVAPSRVIVSRNGRHVYALAADSVFVFELLPDGQLGFVEQQSGTGSPAFSSVADMALTNDGSQLVLASTGTSQLLMFHRDFDAGTLRFGGLADAAAGASLSGVSRLTVTANDQQLVLSQPAGMSLGFWNFSPFSVCPALPASGADALSQTVDIAADGALNLTWTALVNPAARGNMPSDASLTVGSVVVGQDALAGVSEDVAVEHDLMASVLDVTAEPVAGESVSLSTRFSNAGPSSALSGSVTIDLTAAVGTVAWTCSSSGGATCAASGGGALTALAVELPPAGEVQIDLTGNVDPAFFGPLTISGAISEEPGATELAPADNALIFASLPQVVRVSDLSATLQVLDEPWAPGTAVAYRVTVRNDGPSDSIGSLLDLDLPANLDNPVISCASFTSPICPTDGSGFDPATDLPAGTEAVLQVDADLSAEKVAGDVMLGGRIDAAAPITDPQDANNAFAATPLIQRAAALSLVVSDSQDPYDPDGTGPGIDYHADVTNAGPSFADVAVRFTVPEEFTAGATACFLDVSDAGPLEVFECRIEDLPPGSQRLTINMRPRAGTPDGVYEIPAAMFTDAADATSGDDQDIEETTLARGIDVAVTQTVDDTNLVPGEAFTFTAVFTSQGSVDALDVRLESTIDTALVTNLSWSCQSIGGASCDAGAGGTLDAMASLPAGEQVIVTISGRLSAMVDSTISQTLTSTVTATVNDAAGDMFTLNNTATTITGIADVVFLDGFE